MRRDGKALHLDEVSPQVRAACPDADDLRDVVVPHDEPVTIEVDRLDRGVGLQRPGEPHGQGVRRPGALRSAERQRLGLPKAPRQRVVVGERIPEEVQRIERRPPPPLPGAGKARAVLDGLRVPQTHAPRIEDAAFARSGIVDEDRSSADRLDSNESGQPEAPAMSLQPGKQAAQRTHRQVDAPDGRPGLAAVPGDRRLDQRPCLCVHEDQRHPGREPRRPSPAVHPAKISDCRGRSPPRGRSSAGD